MNIQTQLHDLKTHSGMINKIKYTEGKNPITEIMEVALVLKFMRNLVNPIMQFLSFTLNRTLNSLMA